MSQDPRKRPNGTYLPKGERPELRPEDAAAKGLSMLAFALFRVLAVEELKKARAEETINSRVTPGSWAGLEATLGKETVDRIRRGDGWDG